MPWKPELDALVGARHGGQLSSILARLQDLAGRHPQVAEIHYQLAWTHAILDRPQDAVPHYERSIALGLPPNELSGAYLGLGGCWRELGNLARSEEVLRSGAAQFPENSEFRVFLALTLHQLGRHEEVMQLLLTTLMETSQDVGLAAYQRELRYWLQRRT